MFIVYEKCFRDIFVIRCPGRKKSWLGLADRVVSMLDYKAQKDPGSNRSRDAVE